MASINDRITQATTSSRPTPTTVSTIRAAAGGTLTCLALTGWPTGTAVHFITYKINTSGAKIAGSQIDWKGVVSGTTITGLVLQAGTDVGNAVGDVVEAAPTAAYANDLYTWGTKDHDTQGRHTQLTDTNGNLALGITAVASAVNYVNITNSITGAGPTIAPAGTDSNVDLNVNAKGTGVVKVQGAVPQKFFAIYDFVESGIVITADSVGVNKNYSISSGVVWIGGKRLTVAAVSAQTVGASKDRYIDLRDNNDGTAVYITNEVANNSASQALTAGDMRVGIVVAGATTIATTGSLNQGQETAVLPIAASVAYSVTDSLGNLICPRDPSRKVLGYRQTTTNTATADGTGTVAIPGLTVPVIIPAGRKVNLIIQDPYMYNSTATDGGGVNIFDNTSSVGTGADGGGNSARANGEMFVRAENLYTPPASGARTFIGRYKVLAGGTVNTNAGANQPVWLKVELV